MPTLTTTYSFNQPLVNDATDADLWGAQLNTNWGNADQEFGADFVDVASAATTAIGGAASRNVRITGTTGITSFGTVNAGYTRRVRMADAVTITHNATSLILPTGADITTAANDCFVAVSLGSGNWIVTSYLRASGESLSPPGAATTSTLGTVIKADAAAMEAETADRFPDAAILNRHPLVPKGWAVCNGLAGGIVTSSGNITGFTRNSTGDYTVTLSPAFSSANYCIQVTTQDNNTNGNVLRVDDGTVTTSGFDIISRLNTASPSLVDSERIMITVLGDLA